MWLDKVSLILLLISVSPPLGCSQCQFPPSWQGAWHHLGYDDPLNLTLTNIEQKGTCIKSISSETEITKAGFGQFIIQEEKGCLKCLIIYQKHYNVLQYRESDCESRQSLAGRGGGKGLEALCEEIPGDTPLYSMIRVWSKPVSCPLQGPHSVAYGKGGANQQCSHPPSLMDSCTDHSVIQIKYQACPDIQGSESKVERMTCVAKWKEGNKRYFVALVNSKLSQWAEQKDRYQCFLYEDINHQMAMSQGQFTSSCQGLWSVLEGSRTFTLQKLSVKPGCSVPDMMSASPRWRSLSHDLSIILDKNKTSFSFLKSGTLLEQVSCHSRHEDDKFPGTVRMVAHVKSGCSSGYICFNITRLNRNLLKITYGLKSNHPNEACQHYYFSSQSLVSRVLVAENSSSPCPFSGSYSLPGLVSHNQGGREARLTRKNCTTFMQAGCSNSHSLEVKTQCEEGGQKSSTNKQSLLCHGVFTNQDTGNLQLVLSEAGLSYQCLDYREREGVVEGTFLTSTCHTENTDLYVNISSTGPCILPLTAGENTGASSSPPRHHHSGESVLCSLVFLCLQILQIYLS